MRKDIIPGGEESRNQMGNFAIPKRKNKSPIIFISIPLLFKQDYRDQSFSGNDTYKNSKQFAYRMLSFNEKSMMK